MKTKSWLSGCWQLGLTVSLAGVVAGDYAFAQITPDATLGAESSVITPNAVINNLPSDRIDGGAIRGANLFHSFQQFNVGEGRGAYFANPAGIEKIFSRVTGNDPSNILGTLGVLGNADVFLMNPNGIIFGPNASLDVNGSFIASTASSLNFADGTQFSATAPQTTPLLTMSVPIGLQYGGTATEMLLQGSNLAVQPDRTLALVGGKIALAGGDLIAEGGRIELGSVASNSLVSLTPTEKGWALEYEGTQNFQDIQLSQEAAVDASGEGGGDIQVWGRRVTLTDGSRIESTTGAEPGGTLSVTASESVELSGRAVGDTSRLVTSTEGAGSGGNLIINTGRLTVRDGGQVRATTEDAGLGGTLTVNASELVEAISLNSESGELSQLTTRVGRKGTGDGGDLTVETRRLIITDGARVETGTSFQGSAGDLTVRASESVEMSGAVQISPEEDLDRTFLSTTAAREAKGGNAGNLIVETRRLIVRDGARINTSTFSAGAAGNLTVRASESVEVSGGFTFKDEDGKDKFEDSRLATRTTFGGKGGNLLVETGQLTLRDGAQVNVSSERTGNGGNLTIRARQLSLLNRAKLNASSERTGNGGNLTVEADLITLDNESSIAAIAENKEGAGTGNAGNLTIESGQLLLRNGSKVTVSAAEKGNAGNIFMNVRDLLQANDGEISTNSSQSTGGAINITAGDIRLQGDSDIRTDVASGAGGGGNIDLTADSIIAFDDSDILAFAQQGEGGDITLNTPAFFGFSDRPSVDTNPASLDNNNRVDINASGGVAGIITLPDTSFVQNSLTQLPSNLIDTNSLIANSCIARSAQQQGSFIITGAGSLPNRPGDVVTSPYPTGTVRPIPTPASSNSSSSTEGTNKSRPWQLGEPIEEPQGVYRLADGQLVLSRECR